MERRRKTPAQPIDWADSAAVFPLPASTIQYKSVLVRADRTERWEERGQSHRRVAGTSHRRVLGFERRDRPNAMGAWNSTILQVGWMSGFVRRGNPGSDLDPQVQEEVALLTGFALTSGWDPGGEAAERWSGSVCRPSLVLGQGGLVLNRQHACCGVGQDGPRSTGGRSPLQDQRDRVRGPEHVSVDRLPSVDPQQAGGDSRDDDRHRQSHRLRQQSDLGQSEGELRAHVADEE
jgi:hypothetical protein